MNERHLSPQNEIQSSKPSTSEPELHSPRQTTAQPLTFPFPSARLTSLTASLLFGRNVGKILAYYAVCSRSFVFFLSDVRRLAFRLLGWLINAPRQNPLAPWVPPTLLPTLKRWHIAAAAAAALRALYVTFRAARGYFSPRSRLRRQLLAAMDEAPDFETWNALALRLAALQNADLGGADKLRDLEDRVYDRGVLEAKVRQLKASRERGELLELMFHLRSDLVRNFANLTNPELHERFTVAPRAIDAYLEEVRAGLRMLQDGPPHAKLGPDEKAEFVREARHAFGRTALVMSGGGALGSFHLGVVKALLDHGLMPRVIAGSSVGSIIASIVATKTDEELAEVFKHLSDFDLSFFSNRNTLEFLRHFLTQGTLQDIKYLKARLRALFGDLTFQEAYDRTGKVLNVCVTAADTNEPPRLMNYLTAPHAIIWSTVAASSAFPYLFEAQDILAKDVNGGFVRWSPSPGEGRERRWRDGSLEDDLPLRGLSELFNVNYTIVSQTNPHLVPIINLKRVLGRGVADIIEAEIKHRFVMLRKMVPEGSAIARVCRLMTQQWEGDVTVVVPGFFYPLEKLITDPTFDELRAAVMQGQRATWRKIAAIRSNCSIELALDTCLARLQDQARLLRRANPPASLLGGLQGARPLGFRSRVPSWAALHQAALKDRVAHSTPGSSPLATGLAGEGLPESAAAGLEGLGAAALSSPASATGSANLSNLSGSAGVSMGSPRLAGDAYWSGLSMSPSATEDDKARLWLPLARRAVWDVGSGGRAPGTNTLDFIAP